MRALIKITQNVILIVVAHSKVSSQPTFENFYLGGWPPRLVEGACVVGLRQVGWRGERGGGNMARCGGGEGGGAHIYTI